MQNVKICIDVVMLLNLLFDGQPSIWAHVPETFLVPDGANGHYNHHTTDLVEIHEYRIYMGTLYQKFSISQNYLNSCHTVQPDIKQLCFSLIFKCSLQAKVTI